MLSVVLIAAAISGPVIVVTGTRSGQPLREQAGNTAVIGEDEIELTVHTHASELLHRAPGTWVTRGSSQEHLTAIRSPVLTGSGGCGAFLILEDGLPVRPAGFCNANQLIELNSEQARSIEVVRGPGSALYGSNALHGLLNVITHEPDGTTTRTAGLEVGVHGFTRLRGTLADASWRANGFVMRDGGWRDGSAVTQGKFNIRHEGESMGFAFSGTWIEQDVAGFIIGQDTYRNRTLARSDPTPDAFRDMDSQRLSLQLRQSLGEWSVSWRPYARRSRMSFLQHFIPGSPTEDNGHHSVGTQILAELPTGNGDRWLVGADLEWADIFVQQTQAAPITTGSPFLIATRPQGRHYDFTVEAVTLATFAHTERRLSDKWRLSAGLRLEHTRYDYDNRMSSGNLRDDGTACAMGGCLYNRPADRTDTFTVATPKLGLTLEVTDDTDAYVSLSRGHRAPQVNELYRLQRGQDAADIDSERMDSLEFGVRGFMGTLQYDAALFTMRKRNVIFQDTNGFTVNDGRTRHRGLELSLVQPLGEHWAFALAGTIARHTYDFDRVIAGGDTVTRGDEVDTAPRHLASARLSWLPRTGHRVELEGVRVGAHWLDAANRFRYHGHTLVNLRGSHAIGARWSLDWRVTNLADRRYAERADYAFGNYRYFPGTPRSFFISLRATL